MTIGVDLIAQERVRQIDQEHYDPVSDLDYKRAELSRAALCYTEHAIAKINRDLTLLSLSSLWPWGVEFWKPSPDPIRDLVKAGALIAAEIDRIVLSREDQPDNGTTGTDLSNPG